MTQSALNWLGGKARLAHRIVQAFPSPRAYDIYVEPFVGSAAVLFAKHSYTHLEVINDRNARLIGFWLAVRDEVESLRWKLETLPYSQAVFNRYKQSLDTQKELDPIELAARWYYVNRGTIAGHIDSNKGWMYTAPQGKLRYAQSSEAVSYHNAIATLSSLAQRLSFVQIHACDFEKVIGKYQSPRTLFYIDPPYFGAEHYYTVDGTPAFNPEDHKRLAMLLNKTDAFVALSYYEHPDLDRLYPSEKWRRIQWETVKESSKMNKALQIGHEMLLMNYPAQDASLWDECEELPVYAS